MKAISFIFILLLSGCGGSDNDSAFATTQQVQQTVSQIPNESTQIAALRAEVELLKSNQAEMKIIGKQVGTTSASSSLRMMGEFTQAAIPVSFGPCTNMGVAEGSTSLVGDALAAISVAFKTCTGYHTEYNTADGSIKIPPRLFWDGAGCSGNALEWEASGAGYDTEHLRDGVAFSNPLSPSTVLYVPAGQTAQPILIQSAWSASAGCQSDVETQNMYVVSTNITQTTGVPSSAVGKFTTTGP